MPGKTYGEKPIVFKFSEDGEEYMIGSEVSSTQELDQILGLNSLQSVERSLLPKTNISSTTHMPNCYYGYM